MDHTHIVQAGDLDRYAPTRDSQAVIPELVYWLVKQSCSNLAVCRIPYGDAVNQPGWDGMVETEVGFLEFLPNGRSYWEIGTGADPQSKATNDFRKRTDEVDDKERADSSFVFVTPRSSGSGGWNEPEQTKWLERRKEKGWKLIRVIDGVKLADWLREYPAIGKWMATKLNLTEKLGGLSTATEHWNDLISDCTADGPPFPPKLFTIGRQGACEALQALFEGKMQVLMLFAESPQDVADFVSAFLAGLDSGASGLFSNRCLYINDEQAWRSIVETRSPHVLVADPRLGLETDEGAALQSMARRKGHAVVVPLCGAWSGSSPEIIKLRSPSQSQIESVLKESGYTDIRARELARIGGDRISALRRHFRGYGSLPPYATWDIATFIAQAGLIGKWDGSSPADRSALEMLLGKGYGEWIEILRPDTLRSDSPLIQIDEKWRFVARGEAWDSLGGRITDDDLDRFQKTAVSVLEERDPKFDLPKEDRFAASIHGKVLTHSSLIRNGISETLALIGSRPKALTSCSTGKAESTAILVVRNLLNKTSWDRWASLDSMMPLLAEAAPDEFLDAVESVLVDLENTPFHKIFAEEGGGGLGGWNYMSGLLWALETLAWSPEHLSRVSVILADIASFDPGGNWANRPSNSLADIFLPWNVQTTAPFERRKSAVEAVIREQPVVGWKLLLALLPHDHGFSSGCHRPVWRDFIPKDWEEGALKTEYWEQIAAFIDLAVALAKSDSGKLCEMIKRLSDLPKSTHETLLNHLSSNAVISLPEEERLPLWENLNELVRHHQQFSDADWALPADSVNKISETAKMLAPTSPAFKYHHLFGGRDFDLYDERGNYDDQLKRLEEARQTAIIEIIGDGNIDVALNFAVTVAAPYEVGRALGVIASDEMESSILPSLLDSEEEVTARVIAGFIWTRFWILKTEWVDAVLERAWSPEHQSKFLTLLPFEEEIWNRAASQLTAAHEALYWKNAKVNPYGSDCDLTVAIEKLLEHGREGAAVMCVARTVGKKTQFNESLATRALLAVLGSERGIEELNTYQTVELIKHLQESETADKDSLFRIEWNFLPWLDRFSSGSPVTLEKRLASDPAFFTEVIGLVFRSKNISADDCDDPDKQKNYLAKNAYKLLTEWKRCPGSQDDGTFSAEVFNAWINETRRLTEVSGHAEIAQIQIGYVLTCAPPDPDGLWIHNAVATALNFRDTGEMRSGFKTQLFNDRGVYGFSHGQEERRIANDNREKAQQLDSKGYTRFATTMREFAEEYERQAERDAKRAPYED
ncbi:hypothetical protein Sbal175_4320 (plasmid) [Shewanella baltica BA175]|uniref:hypothetical protein n=1 Tax=Shewanella baltica TaxID=62322 RepID=UPI0001E4E181|nr:hypothetical protein [Shewanella baltica]AEG13537.1 hypothetical protein Sbal175_4320 [Shewanella baltica BA175]